MKLRHAFDEVFVMWALVAGATALGYLMGLRHRP
jgi:hypothetical protein